MSPVVYSAGDFLSKGDQMKFTNEHKIGLSSAVFLAHDTYDYDARTNAISATGLLKPVRQAVLSKRVEANTLTMDISQLAASSFGTAVHDGVENAWSHGNHILAMRKLGYAEQIIQRVIVNPKPDQLKEDSIPVYMEQRAEKEVDGVMVTGKFDFVGDGMLEDHKTTGVFTFMKKTNDEKYRLQGSIYRWLNQDIITSDRMLINYTFTDWSKLRSMIEKNKGYPPHKMMSVAFTLMSLGETELWIKSKVRDLKDNIKKTESTLPLCTQEELWQDPTIYKYYKNPKSKLRSTKNFDTFAEAQQRLLKEGSIGVIDIVPGKAKACLYCNAAPICSQAKQMVIDGQLDMEL
jgi:hypothetical protein